MTVPPVANSFEGGTDGVTITAGNSGGASGNAFDEINGSPTFTNVQKIDTMAMRVVDPAGNTGGRWNYGSGLTGNMWFRYYLWISALPTTNSLRPLGTFNFSPGNTNMHSAVFTSGFMGAVRSDGTDIVASAGTVQVPLSAWFRVEVRMLPSTTAAEFEWKWWSDRESAGAPTDTKVTTGIVGQANIGVVILGSIATLPTNPYTNYMDGLAISTTGWIGPAVGAVGRIFKRFYGPALLTNAAADLYTVPTGRRATIRHIHASNPTASPVDFTLSIGADAAATRLYDGYPVPADDLKQEFRDHTLTAGEKIQGFAGTTSVLNLTIDGYEESV